VLSVAAICLQWYKHRSRYRQTGVVSHVSAPVDYDPDSTPPDHAAYDEAYDEAYDSADNEADHVDNSTAVNILYHPTLLIVCFCSFAFSFNGFGIFFVLFFSLLLCFVFLTKINMFIFFSFECYYLFLGVGKLLFF
jgi:Ca2+-dependent lipid-binding protein